MPFPKKPYISSSGSASRPYKVKFEGREIGSFSYEWQAVKCIHSWEEAKWQAARRKESDERELLELRRREVAALERIANRGS